ncbi:MAG: helix-turn-helix domain-containing protein [Candidatus Diapherotrites archaeon]|nr:helix-turn-helix domain-containing protein [Candidatus Diapherotrites archaeon]
MNEAQLKAISDPTRLKILGLLAQESLTNTELFDKLDKKKLGHGLKGREAVYKALKKLKNAGLIKRTFKERVGYKYTLDFAELKVEGRLILKIK